MERPARAVCAALWWPTGGQNSKNHENEVLIMTDDSETSKALETPSSQGLLEGMSAAQIAVCRCVAEYMRPAEIMRLCADALAGGEITESWIRHMVSPANRPEKYQAVVAYFRRLAWQRRQDIKICDPIERAKARQRIIERNEAKDDDLVRQVLLDADKAYGESSEDKAAAVAVQVNVGDFAGLQSLSGQGQAEGSGGQDRAAIGDRRARGQQWQRVI